MKRVNSARTMTPRGLAKFGRRIIDRILEIAPAAFAAERQLGVPADWLIAADLVGSRFGTVRTTLPFGRALDSDKTMAQNEAAMWDPSENCRLLAAYVAGRYPEAIQVRHDPVAFTRVLYKDDPLYAARVVDVIGRLQKFISNLRPSRLATRACGRVRGAGRRRGRHVK